MSIHTNINYHNDSDDLVHLSSLSFSLNSFCWILHFFISFSHISCRKLKFLLVAITELSFNHMHWVFKNVRQENIFSLGGNRIQKNSEFSRILNFQLAITPPAFSLLEYHFYILINRRIVFLRFSRFFIALQKKIELSGKNRHHK